MEFHVSDLVSQGLSPDQTVLHNQSEYNMFHAALVQNRIILVVLVVESEFECSGRRPWCAVSDRCSARLCAGMILFCTNAKLSIMTWTIWPQAGQAAASFKHIEKTQKTYQS
jgi:hypothetical protein